MQARKDIDKVGLLITSGGKPVFDERVGIAPEMYFPSTTALNGSADFAKALGLEYAGCAWADHKGDLDEKQAREIASVFNHAGEVLAKHGLKFFYHCHGFEFQPHGDGTLMAIGYTHLSGEEAWDKACIEAAKAAVPYPAVPVTLRADAARGLDLICKVQ